LGVAALEDKIVQQAVVTVLNQIYEEDFLGFSYGFRPEESARVRVDEAIKMLAQSGWFDGWE
jgi:retron-type reverse transcriptase